jgi:hypothetical protein
MFVTRVLSGQSLVGASFAERNSPSVPLREQQIVDIVVSTSKTSATPVGRKVDGPVHDLIEVKRLASLSRVPDGTLQDVIDALACSPDDAHSYVLDIIRNLSAPEYCETREMDYIPPVKGDVYGVRNDEGDWYVKFYFQHGRVTVTSCHPPKWPLTRIDGLTIA